MFVFSPALWLKLMLSMVHYRTYGSYYSPLKETVRDSTTRLREVPGCACFSCHLPLFLLSLTRSLKCCEGVEVVQPPDWLSPSCTERGNEKGFPPCPFPNLQHRGLLVPVLVPSWWGRGCPCSLWWLLGSGTWDSCKPRAVCGLRPPALHRLISPVIQCWDLAPWWKLIGTVSWSSSDLYFPF